MIYFRTSFHQIYQRYHDYNLVRKAHISVLLRFERKQSEIQINYEWKSIKSQKNPPKTVPNMTKANRISETCS